MPPSLKAPRVTNYESSAGSLSLSERVDLLSQVARLLAVDDRASVRALIDPLSPGIFEVEPEVALYCTSMLIREGRYAEGLDLLEFVRSATETTGDWRLRTRHQNLEGQICFFIGEPARASMLFHDALSAAESHGDVKLSAHCYSNLGIIAGASGEYELSIACLARARALFSTTQGTGDSIAAAFHMSGMAYRALGRFSEAADAFAESVSRQAYHTESALVKSQIEHARLLIDIGDGVAARAQLTLVETAIQKESTRYIRGEYLFVCGALAVSQGKHADAWKALDEALSEARSYSDPLLEAEVLEEMAKLGIREGDRTRAELYARESVSVYDRLGYPLRSTRVRSQLRDGG